MRVREIKYVRKTNPFFNADQMERIGACNLNLKLLAPPANGENDPSQGEDWAENYYTQINKCPEIRLRFEPIEL